MPDAPATAGAAAPASTRTRPPGKVIVVMPAMNAARPWHETVASIPRDWVDEVILVDDHSTDEHGASSPASCRSTSSGTRTTPATAPTRRRVTSRRSSAAPTPS